MTDESASQNNPTPSELMRLPRSIRQRFLADAAAKAEAEYASNVELMDFEAFALEALDG